VLALKAEVAGLKPADQNVVRLTLYQTITLCLKMQVAGMAETVNGLASSPVVDTTSAVGGVSVGQEIFDQLAVRRDIYGLTRFAPGVTKDTLGPSFYGSTSAENSYIIDRLNPTGADTGTEGKTLNPDYIQDVQLQ